MNADQGVDAVAKAMQIEDKICILLRNHNLFSGLWDTLIGCLESAKCIGPYLRDGIFLLGSDKQNDNTHMELQTYWR